MHPHIIKHIDVLQFITAGKALFTIRSIKSGNRFTYKVGAPKTDSKEDPSILFVQVLTGPDNGSNYSYIGFLRKAEDKWYFSYGTKSRISAEALSVVAFNWLINRLAKPLNSFTGHSPQVEVWHEGKCCRCGRTLTVPESIESGIGPECLGIKTKFQTKKSLEHAIA